MTSKAWFPYDRPNRPKKCSDRRSGRLYGNATRTIANDPDRFKIYTIVPIVRIELNSIQAIEVVSVVRVVCDRLFMRYNSMFSILSPRFIHKGQFFGNYSCQWKQCYGIFVQRMARKGHACTVAMPTPAVATSSSETSDIAIFSTWYFNTKMFSTIFPSKHRRDHSDPKYFFHPLMVRNQPYLFQISPTFLQNVNFP